MAAIAGRSWLAIQRLAPEVVVNNIRSPCSGRRPRHYGTGSSFASLAGSVRPHTDGCRAQMRSGNLPAQWQSLYKSRLRQSSRLAELAARGLRARRHFDFQAGFLANRAANHLLRMLRRAVGGTRERDGGLRPVW